MKSKSIGSDVAKTTKNIAKQAAKQVMQEPVEVLKSASTQVSGKETANRQIREKDQDQIQPEPQRLNEEEMKQKGKRIVQALEEEIEDIKRQKKEEEQMEKQTEMESVEAGIKPLPEVSSKQSRGNIKGIKGKLKKLKTKAEIRMPPSG